MDIVDKIIAEDIDLATKIIQLWAVSMLHYRQPLGDKAWEGINQLTKPGVSAAIAFLTGYSSGEKAYEPQMLKKLIGNIYKEVL